MMSDTAKRERVTGLHLHIRIQAVRYHPNRVVPALTPGRFLDELQLLLALVVSDGLGGVHEENNGEGVVLFDPSGACQREENKRDNHQPDYERKPLTARTHVRNALPGEPPEVDIGANQAGKEQYERGETDVKLDWHESPPARKRGCQAGELAVLESCCRIYKV